jgi:hypothetical protein
MQERIQGILSEQVATKTSKIQKLILLGLTRKEIAALVTNGNYGFVQNVYAKMKRDGQLDSRTPQRHDDFMNRRFGVEFEAYNVTKEKLCSALRSAGIECEIEGYNHITRAKWKIVNDGSIEGCNTFELVSPILSGEDGISTLKIVCSVLNECRAKVNKTCGTHVHIDAADFTLSQWKRIYINYYRLEKTIDAFMPESRRHNSYCERLVGISEFESKINRCNSLEQIAGVFGHSRYYKVNPMSYSRHNTCEFRQHGGTIEFEKISSWIKFVNNLVELSRQCTVQNTRLESLNFCSQRLIRYFKQRTLKLSA